MGHGYSASHPAGSLSGPFFNAYWQVVNLAKGKKIAMGPFEEPTMASQGCSGEDQDASLV